MAVKLNRKGFAFGKELVNEGRSVRDERDVRSVERGSTEHPEDTKGRYKFPFGDFKRVHRCAVLSAESRVG